MPDRVLSLKNLRKILRRYSVWEDPSRGKGSHTTFLRDIDGSTFSFPMPTRNDILIAYVRGVRRALKLTQEDGVTDDEFYNG